MHSTLFAIIFSLFVLTTFVHSAPTASLDSATLLNNALEAQKLNAQFQTANTATGPCNNGDTTCVQGAIATCVNGQFDTSQGLCPANQQCFALPSVNSNGTTITCTSEKIALSLIEAAGATGGITGSGSGGSSINPSSTSSTSSGTTSSTATLTDSSTTPTSTALDDSVVTVTQTVQVLASSTTTLPTVTQTLSPEEAANFLSSLLAQGGPTTTATSDVLSSTTPTSATNIPSSSASPDASATPVDIANATASPTGLGSASGGYSGY